MSLKRRFVFILLVNEEHARILTGPLYDIKNAAWLPACFLLKFVEEFNHFFLMSAFNRHMHCQNQHFTSALGASVLSEKPARAFLQIEQILFTPQAAPVSAEL